MGKRKLTDKNISEICYKYSIDLCLVRALAKEYGVSTTTINKLLRKNGYPARRIFTDEYKWAIIEKYKTGKYNDTELAKEYNIDHTVISRFLRKAGYIAKSQSELRRIYQINETFFDKIDTEEKAYFLGFLYSDGYNNTDTNSVKLSLNEDDVDILIRLNNLVHENKPLWYSKIKDNNRNAWILSMNNKHISKRLVELGCPKAKTFKIKFPTEEQVPTNLISHFIRGMVDGDGWIGKKTGARLISTLDVCETLSNILKETLNINSYIKVANPGSPNNVYELSLTNKMARTFLKWLYKDSTIYLERKYQRYLVQLRYDEYLIKKRICSIEGCSKVHHGCGYCKNHYREFIERPLKIKNMLQKKLNE